jgi:hypothetical protein
MISSAETPWASPSSGIGVDPWALRGGAAPAPNYNGPTIGGTPTPVSGPVVVQMNVVGATNPDSFRRSESQTTAKLKNMLAR